jgi:hypothetical protein
MCYSPNATYVFVVLILVSSFLVVFEVAGLDLIIFFAFGLLIVLNLYRLLGLLLLRLGRCILLLFVRIDWPIDRWKLTRRSGFLNLLIFLVVVDFRDVFVAFGDVPVRQHRVSECSCDYVECPMGSRTRSMA